MGEPSRAHTVSVALSLPRAAGCLSGHVIEAEFVAPSQASHLVLVAHGAGAKTPRPPPSASPPAPPQGLRLLRTQGAAGKRPRQPQHLTPRRGN